MILLECIGLCLYYGCAHLIWFVQVGTLTKLKMIQSLFPYQSHNLFQLIFFTIACRKHQHMKNYWDCEILNNEMAPKNKDAFISTIEEVE